MERRTSDISLCWNAARPAKTITFHGLVLGLLDRNDRVKWMERWFELAGDSRIEYFREGGNAISYAVKTIRPGIESDIIFELGD
jgi:hypothetical protein